MSCVWLLICVFALGVDAHPYGPCQSTCANQQLQQQPVCGSNPTCGGSFVPQFSRCCSNSWYPPNFGSFLPPGYPTNYPILPPTNYPPANFPNQPPIIIVGPGNNPNAGNKDPIKVSVNTDNKIKEWLCPVDSQPRLGDELTGDQGSAQTPTECQFDENCPSEAKRQKCCFDYGIGRKVCKPAIQK